MYKCSRCGAELTNKVIRINGVIFCEKCARAMGYDRFLDNPSELVGAGFSPIDELAANFMKLADLDFGNSSVTCPKCGLKLRDFENSGKLGCIECYNTFNDYVVKEMFRQQGESEYAGRMPGQFSGEEAIGMDAADSDANKAAPTPVIFSNSKEDNNATDVKAQPVSNESGKVKTDNTATDIANTDKLAKLEKADIGMLSDEELKEGIKLATDVENYQLAIRLRDELNGRKAGE